MDQIDLVFLRELLWGVECVMTYTFAALTSVDLYRYIYFLGCVIFYFPLIYPLSL